MMFIIDTNVLLVANGVHRNFLCIQGNCTSKLNEIMRQGIVCIDNRWLIIKEYKNKIDDKKKPPSPGSKFLKHVLSNLVNSKRIRQVTITPSNGPNEPENYREFPQDMQDFDPADRKFIAVAAGSSANPESRPVICEAADCKWIVHENALIRNGITVDFVDRNILMDVARRKGLL